MTQHIKAFDPSQLQGPVPSPCINVCRLDEQKTICVGCWRTVEEIIAWSRADDEYKLRVWQEIKRRVAQSGT